MTVKDKLQTHCKRGHEFTRENTYVSKTGCRHCRNCRQARSIANPQKYDPVLAKARRSRWNAKNPEYFKHHHIKRHYGLTPEEFEEKWTAQDGKCGICKCQLKRDKSTHVDHDHETQQVRDLLCQTCNHGIGSLQDSVVVVESALAYLRKHKDG